MYVFPSPEHPQRLVLVMNVLPNAGTTRWFSHALDFRFRLRQAEISGTGANAGFSVGTDALTFRCVYSDLEASTSDKAQTGRCASSGVEILVEVGHQTSHDKYVETGVRVFAGSRFDPFFMDVPGYIQSMKEGKLKFTGENTAQDKNALSIVIELDSNRFLSNPDGMFAVVSEVRTRGGESIVLDTFGRPEITNVILADPSSDPVNGTVDLRALFNQQDPFGEPGPYSDPFRMRVDANLHRMDTMDGEIDWQLQNGAHPLTALHTADDTVIDPSKPVGVGSWLEIEKAMVEVREHETGGGRWRDDDICDIKHSFLVARDRQKTSDSVDQPTKLASKSFPFLNDPLASN